MKSASLAAVSHLVLEEKTVGSRRRKEAAGWCVRVLRLLTSAATSVGEKASSTALLGALYLVAVALAGCATQPKGAAYDPKAPPAPYLRIAYPDEDTVELQIASRRFAPARGRGPVVWLVGASHIGETNYYASLQKQLDARTLVLYEGVGEHSRRTRSSKAPWAPPPAPARKATSAATTNATDDDYSLQDSMAKALGLVFQLEAMDYDRTNFFNSDLSIAEIQALMQPGGIATTTRPGVKAATTDEDESNEAFRDLLKAMDGTSSFGKVLKGVMQLIGGSPKMQAMMKLALIETLGVLRADPTNMKGLPADMQKLLEVLIRERNKVVVEDLRRELKRGRRGTSIAVFYGAGHLPDMEMRFRNDLNLRPGEDVWLPAFSVNTARAGLSNFELNFIRSIIRSQLGPLTK